jgi:prepilin-type N-terminal cleavage/methylation domain-containing protein
MKTPSKPFSRKGFTLIELLVVIAIIAVLASAGFAVGPAMMNRAKKLSAQATATNIANAVEQFYTEYSALPDPGSNSADAEFATNVSPLLDILAGGSETKSIEQNPRKIRFLSVKEAKNRMDGALYTEDPISKISKIDKILDPWGQPFYIMLDYDYDEKLKVDPVSGSAPISDLNGRRVAVYSLGVKPPATANAKTLVKTW